MNDAKMEEEEYVETSDVEELANAYGSEKEAYFEDVDSFVPGRLLSTKFSMLERNPSHYSSPRKKRKLNPSLQVDTWGNVDSSQSPTPKSGIVTLQLARTHTQSQSSVAGREDRNASKLSEQVEMEVNGPLTSQISSASPIVSQINLTMSASPIEKDKKPQASWKPVPQTPHSQRTLRHDYEGDLLDQFDHSLSPQVFSPQRSSTQREALAEGIPLGESDDELAIVPRRSTSPLSTSQTGSRTSRMSIVIEHTPLSFPTSSPCESAHSHAERPDIPTNPNANDTSSPRNSVSDRGNMNDDTATRYPLRRRRPNQIRPYLFDEFQYKAVLKDNREAFVNVLNLHRRHANQRDDRYEEEEEEYVEEESQQQNKPNNESEIHEGQAQLPDETDGTLPDYIDALSESDDEPDSLIKEARRMAREKRRKEKEKAMERQKQKEEEAKRRARERLNREEEIKRRLKRFPVSNASIDPERSNTAAAATRLSSLPRGGHSRTPSVSNATRALPVQPRFLERETNDELNALQEYFMDDFSNEDEVTHDVGPEPERPSEFQPPSDQAPAPEPFGVIEVDDTSSPVQNHQELEGSDSVNREGPQKDLNKRYRELYKLYPPKMARGMLEKGKHKPRRRQLESDDSVEEEPLLPGQSRIRWAANTGDVREVRGDSESEDNEPEGRSHSPPSLYDGDIRDFIEPEAPFDHIRLSSEGRGVGRSRFSVHRRQGQFSASVPEVIEISDEEESTDSSEEEQVDEEDIRNFLGDDDAGTIYDMDLERGTIKEESMIDWMLSQTHIVGSTISKPKTTWSRGSRRIGQAREGRSKTSWPRIDVTTRGAVKYGKERQTLLSFEKHTSNRHSGSRNDWPKAGRATEPIEVEIPEPGTTGRKGWKEKLKERKERARLQGVYSLANPQTTGITSGRRKKPIKVTVDSNDDGFYQSFASRPPPPVSDPVRKPNLRTDHHFSRADTALDHNQRIPVEPGEHQCFPKRPRGLVGKCTVDMGIETLQLGTVFGPTTFIRQGYLQSSIDILTLDYVPPRPDPTYLCGINISPLMDVDVFLRSLDRIFDGMQGFTSDIPSDGYEETLKDWDKLSRSTCQHISWLYLQYSEDARNRLSAFLKAKILSIITSLKSRDIPPDALNIALLSLCWLCVESSIRAGYRLYEETSGPQELNPVHAALRLCLHYLIGYGLRKSYKEARKSQVLSEIRMQTYAAQMWVYLIHILPVCDARRSINLNQENPLWSELLSYYQSQPSVNSLETGEAMWKAVFALMALSQFSVLGVATSNFRLSASWEFVAHAIKQVQSPQSNSNLGKGTLQKRDKYILVVISRCYRLLDFWHWKMNHSFGALNQFVHIFRARNFVNLHREDAEYPEFMLNCDWDSLSQPHSENDSAFTLVLKLFMRAATSNCLTNAETKKMIALIIPVKRFRVLKESVPGVNDLSPICNRFAALALAIAIEPGNATRAVNQVHSSIDFSSSDSTTQLLTIRGIRLLASLMIKRDVPLQEIAKWLATIIEIVASEFKTLKLSTVVVPGQQSEHRNKIRNYSLLILSLYATGRAVMETFATVVRYPEPAFLLAYRPFFEKDCLAAIEEANCNLCEMRRFVESFLNARAAYLPLKEPVLSNIHIDDPESQDYGSFDFGIDFSDPSTLAQLEGPQHNFASIRDKEQGTDFQHKIIFQCFWVSKRKIHRFCEAATEPVLNHDLLRTLDSWTHCLVGCTQILIQNGTLPDWTFCQNEMAPIWNIVRVAWLQVRVRLSVFLEIVRYHPPFFNLKNYELLETFFESLAIPDFTVEPRFWRYIVAHEITNNPLFKDTAGLFTELDGEITLDASKIRELQLSILRVLFGNIETRLGEAPTNPEATTWINLCLKFFSAIRSVSQDFSRRPNEGTTYSDWRKDVLALLGNHPRLRNHSRLGTILDLLS